MLNVLAIANCRSLRDVVIHLKQLNVVTGANGTGKSSLYRALRLLADTAQGRVVPSLAREGGPTSTLWAGPETIAASVRRGEYPLEGTVRKQRGYSSARVFRHGVWIPHRSRLATAGQLCLRPGS